MWSHEYPSKLSVEIIDIYMYVAGELSGGTELRVYE